MMALLFGKVTYFVGEGQGINEIIKAIHALQAFNAIVLGDIPLRHLLAVLCQFLIGYLRRTNATCFAFHLCQFFHCSSSSGTLMNRTSRANLATTWTKILDAATASYACTGD